MASYAGACQCDGLLHSTRSAVLRLPQERQCGRAAALHAGQLLGSCLALLCGLAKGARWNEEAVQQPQTFSPHEIALGNLGKAGFLMSWARGGGFGAVGVEFFS